MRHRAPSPFGHKSLTTNPLDTALRLVRTHHAQVLSGRNISNPDRLVGSLLCMQGETAERILKVAEALMIERGYSNEPSSSTVRSNTHGNACMRTSSTGTDVSEDVRSPSVLQHSWEQSFRRCQRKCKPKCTYISGRWVSGSNEP